MVKKRERFAEPIADNALHAPMGGNQRSLLIAGGTLATLLTVWAYWPTLREMVQQWLHQPDYSHGLFVVPIAVFFLWLKRSEIQGQRVAPSFIGVTLLALAGVLRVAAAVFYLKPLDGWTIPLWIAGIIWSLCGMRVLRWSLPSVAFLWFMVPIPYSIETWLSVPLQSIATKISAIVLVMLGQPAITEGNTIWIGEHHLFVEEACSGLRIFVGIFALAFAFALFSRWTWWQKGLALCAALPVAIAANACRIVATGLLYEFASSETAKRFSHDLSGLLSIPLAALIFWLFLVFLDHLFPQIEQLSAVEVGSSDRS